MFPLDTPQLAAGTFISKILECQFHLTHSMNPHKQGACSKNRPPKYLGWLLCFGVGLSLLAPVPAHAGHMQSALDQGNILRPKLDGRGITLDARLITPTQTRPQHVIVKFESRPPAEAAVFGQYDVGVSKDTGSRGIILLDDIRGEVFSASLAELRPQPSAALQLRMNMAVQRLGAELLQALKVKAEESLRSRGS